MTVRSRRRDRPASVRSEVRADARKLKAGADDVRRGARRAGRKTEKALDNHWVERGARLGYVVRAGLYMVIGILALLVALGLRSEGTDQRGSLFLLRGSPLLYPVLITVIVGLGGYSLWGFVRAVFDPLHRGSDANGIVARLGFAWSGLSYTGLLLFTIQFLLGATRQDGHDSIQVAVRTALDRPFGAVATGLAGVIAVAAGLGQFVDAYRAGFKKDLKRGTMSRRERLIADGLGRFGMFSRGVIFSMLGWFVLQAALHHDARRAESMGATFRILAAEPFGHAILAAVAVGFVA
ncbi:MAG: DUF1206 domain-containing protein, partial [Candidatus Dormibacteria bacterium]